MNKRLLFCVETNHQSETDDLYIRETIKRFYEDNKKVTYRTYFLKTKTRYKSRATTNAISEFYSNSAKENTHIIFFIDTDNYDVDPEAKKLLDEIRDYCNRKGYELVLFCRDVEDVYWGRQVSGTEKTKMAKDFKKAKRISSVREDFLRKTVPTIHSSNILTVLDKFFIKKDKGIE